MTVTAIVTVTMIRTVAATAFPVSAPSRARMIPRTRRVASYFLGSGGWEKNLEALVVGQGSVALPPRPCSHNLLACFHTRFLLVLDIKPLQSDVALSPFLPSFFFSLLSFSPPFREVVKEGVTLLSCRPPPF